MGATGGSSVDTHDGTVTPNSENDRPAGAGQENLPDASWLARNGPFLMLFLALILYMIYKGWDLEGFWSIAKAALGLGFVIFIHELGHFAVAKWCNVRVMTFSLGFGPALPGCSFRYGETLYKIALLPIGGYVNMLGEGDEGNDTDVDPRSYKNKSVWQRMAIISAGVIMNVILALGCFVFVYMTKGAERMPARIDVVDVGSPIWKNDTESPDHKRRGVHRGDDIYQIGERKAHDPFKFVWFDDDLMPVVMLSQAGDELTFVFGPPDAPERDWTYSKISPRMNKSEYGDQKPVIGMAPSAELKLLPGSLFRKQLPSPVARNSVAANAKLLGSDTDVKHKGFWFDDEIIGSTDPDHPDQVTELPIDPTDLTGKRHDYFAFQRRLKALAGKNIVIRVRRPVHGDPEDENAVFKEYDFEVPAAYRYTLGMRMVMGPIAAVRYPAKNHDIQESDIIDSVGVFDQPTKKKLRWVTTRSKDKLPEDVREFDLDPDRLAFELDQWAARQPDKDDRKVTFSLRRKNPPAIKEAETIVKATVPWDDTWRDNAELPLGFSSPLSLKCLGIAYRVKTTIGAVAPDSPAADAEVEAAVEVKYHAGDTIQIQVRPGDSVKRDGAAVEFEEGKLFTLKPGDELTRIKVKESGWWIFKTAAESKTYTVAKDEKVLLLPGDHINLREDDVIKEVNSYYYKYDYKRDKDTEEAPKNWIELTENQWTKIPFEVSASDTHKMSFKVKRDERDTVLQVTVKGTPDETWPLEGRGLHFVTDSRLKKAKDFGDAVAMGVDTTKKFIFQIYGMLRSLASGQVSPKNFAGPIGIAVMAFNLAGHNIYQFVLFLGIISVNLAVVNFLPIPVLDGGHMVFLTWEAIRGRPASERVRGALTYLGLALIACMMLFVIYLDVSRL
jgi:regulator of sigma E protease